jgi:glucose/arabinose dehydrogenase
VNRRRGHFGWATVALAGVALAALAGSVALAHEGAAAAAKPVTIRVDAREFSFKLSRRSVPAGTTVRFVVRNRGRSVHDFVIAGKRTRRLKPGRTQTLTVRFPRPKRVGFRCSVPGHARRGMKGVFVVTRVPPPPPPPPPPVDVSSLVQLTRVGTLSRPVLVTAPPGDDRVFVVEQPGVVRVIKAGMLLERPFLDIRDRVLTRNEAGLLGMAFAPDYATSGLVYVYYSARRGSGDIDIVEYRRFVVDPDRLDPGSARVVLSIPEPWENHNAGMLQFGPDGMLYVAVGDGDSGVVNPPGAFAQTLDDLLGSILRIDPRHGSPYAIPADNPFAKVPGARGEVWAIGLRNPWRFWIDHPTGRMFIGDVGNGEREEIDVVPSGASGLNFGWPCLEGTLAFDANATCESPVPPLLETYHGLGACSMIGGVVVHDPRLAALEGRYLYGDFCLGRVTALELDADGAAVLHSDDLGLDVPGLTSFGVDAAARVYATTIGGDVYRLDPR